MLLPRAWRLFDRGQGSLFNLHLNPQRPMLNFNLGFSSVSSTISGISNLSGRFGNPFVTSAVGYKAFKSTPGTTYPYAVVEMKGRRPYMEDKHVIIPNIIKDINNSNINGGNAYEKPHQSIKDSPFFESKELIGPISVYGVCDGHGGPEAAMFVTQNIESKLQEEMGILENELISNPSVVAKDFSQFQPGQNSTTIEAAMNPDEYNYSKNMADITPQKTYGESDDTVSEISRFTDARSALSYGASSRFNNLNSSKDKIGRLKQLLIETFRSLDNDFLQIAKSRNLDDGTTAISAVVSPYRLTVANTGDSRAVLIKKNWSCEPLSVDHKPNLFSERERITKLGGTVVFWGVWRVQGVLAVSRAIGDKILKPFVIPDPEVKSIEISDDDAFLVLATDGLWDVMSNTQVAATLRRCHTPQLAAEILAKTAFTRDSMDNVTVVVVDLRDSASVKRKAAAQADLFAKGFSGSSSKLDSSSLASRLSSSNLLNGMLHAATGSSSNQINKENINSTGRMHQHFD